MAGKTRPSLRAKTLQNVDHSNLSLTDKECIHQVFKAFEELNNADVVEVVRCSGCVHWQPLKEDRISKGVCYNEECGNCMSYTRPIDFCSYGERSDT